MQRISGGEQVAAAQVLSERKSMGKGRTSESNEKTYNTHPPSPTFGNESISAAPVSPGFDYYVLPGAYTNNLLLAASSNQSERRTYSTNKANYSTNSGLD
jgi:hypothetical protein